MPQIPILEVHNSKATRAVTARANENESESEDEDEEEEGEEVRIPRQQSLIISPLPNDLNPVSDDELRLVISKMEKKYQHNFKLSSDQTNGIFFCVKALLGGFHYEMLENSFHGDITRVVQSTYAHLADVMGNGKTLQALCIIFVYHQITRRKTIFFCPTSLISNLLEEITKVRLKALND